MSLRDLEAKGDVSRDIKRRPLVGVLFVVLGVFEEDRAGVAGILHLSWPQKHPAWPRRRPVRVEATMRAHAKWHATAHTGRRC